MGFKVKDTITGFEGVVTAHAAYITGCDQLLVTPEVKKDGKESSPSWMDEGRVVAVGSAPTPAAKKLIAAVSKQASTGGPDRGAPIR